MLIAPFGVMAQTDNFESFGASNMTSIFSAGLGITNPFAAGLVGGTAKCNFLLGTRFTLGAQLFYTNYADANTGIQTNNPGYYAQFNISSSFYLLGENAVGKKGVYVTAAVGYVNDFKSFSVSSPQGTQTNEWAYAYNGVYHDQYLSATGGVGVDYKLYHGRIFAEVLATTCVEGNDIYSQSGVSGAAFQFSNKYKIDVPDIGKFGSILFSAGYNYFF